MNRENTPILQSSASLFNGSKQLPGKLALTQELLLFTFDDFQQSHVNLKIPLKEIEAAEVFLIFNISRNGLKIMNRDGHFDLFILDNPAAFRKAIGHAMDGTMY